MSEEKKEELSNLEKINKLLKDKAVLTEQEIGRLQSLGQINDAYFENLRRQESLLLELAKEKEEAFTTEGELQKEFIKDLKIKIK